MVPEGWSKIRLDHHAKHITSGSRGWAEYYADEGDVFVRITNLRRSSIKPDWSKTKYVALPEGMNEGLRTRLTTGDILISITADLGIVGFIPEEPNVPHYINQHVALVRLDGDNIDPEFVAYSLSSDAMRHAMQRLNDAGAKAGLSLPTIRSVPINVPPLPEQRKIADILSTWDQAIEKAEALLSNAHTQKRALMQQLLTGKRRFPAFEGQPWKEVRLGDVCTPKQWPTISQKEMTDEGFPVFGANGFIGFYSTFNHKNPTTVVTCRGATCGNVSRTPAKTYITGNAMSLDDCDLAIVDEDFLFQLLSRRGFNDIISGSAQPQIIGKDIRSVKVRVPSLSEQKQIAETLTDADAHIDHHVQDITKLRAEKKALMQQLLTGKRRVNLEDEHGI